MKVFWRFLCVMFFCQGTLFAAALSRPNQLINIPIYEPFKRGEVQYGLAAGLHSDRFTDLDFMMSYALMDHVRIGATLVDPTTVLTHVHLNFFEVGNKVRFAVAGGIENMSSNPEASYWGAYPSTTNITFSQYVTTTFSLGPVSIYQGLGTRRFQQSPSVASKNPQISGYFAGISLPFVGNSRLNAEFDGRDYNLGLMVPIKDYARLNMAFTELFLLHEKNPNYDQAPVRYFTLGVTFTHNILFLRENERKAEEARLKKIQDMKADVTAVLSDLKRELAHYELQRKELNQYVLRLQTAMKEDAAYIEEKDVALKAQKRQHYLSLEKGTAEKVMKYYYESLELYAKKDFLGSVEKLHAALILDPNMPQLYVRLGSVYYEMGLKSEAVLEWEKALKLDPKNETLKRLLQ